MEENMKQKYRKQKIVEKSRKNRNEISDQK